MSAGDVGEGLIALAVVGGILIFTLFNEGKISDAIQKAQQQEEVTQAVIGTVQGASPDSSAATAVSQVAQVATNQALAAGATQAEAQAAGAAAASAAVPSRYLPNWVEYIWVQLKSNTDLKPAKRIQIENYINSGDYISASTLIYNTAVNANERFANPNSKARPRGMLAGVPPSMPPAWYDSPIGQPADPTQYGSAQSF